MCIYVFIKERRGTREKKKKKEKGKHVCRFSYMWVLDVLCGRAWGQVWLLRGHRPVDLPLAQVTFSYYFLKSVLVLVCVLIKSMRLYVCLCKRERSVYVFSRVSPHPIMYPVHHLTIAHVKTSTCYVITAAKCNFFSSSFSVDTVTSCSHLTFFWIFFFLLPSLFYFSIPIANARLSMHSVTWRYSPTGWLVAT